MIASNSKLELKVVICDLSEKKEEEECLKVKLDCSDT